uniref:hypothetical protein n=1 Tax=Escherichia coli TaxID=562 RepID=UPI001BC8B1BD
PAPISVVSMCFDVMVPGSPLVALHVPVCDSPYVNMSYYSHPDVLTSGYRNGYNWLPPAHFSRHPSAERPERSPFIGRDAVRQRGVVAPLWEKSNEIAL